MKSAEPAKTLVFTKDNHNKDLALLLEKTKKLLRFIYNMQTATPFDKKTFNTNLRLVENQNQALWIEFMGIDLTTFGTPLSEASERLSQAVNIHLRAINEKIDNLRRNGILRFSDYNQYQIYRSIKSLFPSKTKKHPAKKTN